MKVLKTLSLLILMTGIIAGCNTFRGKEKAKELETGKIIDNTPSLADQSVTYSVYLPKGYKPGTAYPVILAFDPHGTGNLPVAMYKELAEKYGYILVGSDNSRNGMDANAIMSVINSMLKEVKERFSVDSSRIYTLGFSGGARVAVIAAFNPGGIASVTGSGAGFPNTGSANPLGFDYLGMAGTYDFNMHELLMLDEYLDQAQNHHALMLFNGIHEWPPVNVMEKSFLWNDFCAMRNNRLKRNDEEIAYYHRMQDSLIEVMRKNNDLIGMRREMRNAINFLDQLVQTGQYKSDLEELEKSADYQKALTRMKKEQEQELALQHDIQEKFFQKDTSWWKNQMAMWEKVISQGKNDPQELMTRRLKSYLSLVCYMNYTRAMEARDTNASAHAMWIYQKVDPEHAEQTRNGK